MQQLAWLIELTRFVTSKYAIGNFVCKRCLLLKLHIAAHVNDRYQQHRLCHERMASFVELFLTVICEPLLGSFNMGGVDGGGGGGGLEICHLLP